MYVSVRGVARRAALLVVTGDGRRGRNVQHATAKIARITYASLENVFQRIGRLARIG
jgi:predicted nucleotidyltransferase